VFADWRLSSANAPPDHPATRQVDHRRQVRRPPTSYAGDVADVAALELGAGPKWWPVRSFARSAAGSGTVVLRQRFLQSMLLADWGRCVLKLRFPYSSGDDGTRTHDPLLAKQVL
jgi:hypothetical protein